MGRIVGVSDELGSRLFTSLPKEALGLLGSWIGTSSSEGPGCGAVGHGGGHGASSGSWTVSLGIIAGTRAVTIRYLTFQISHTCAPLHLHSRHARSFPLFQLPQQTKLMDLSINWMANLRDQVAAKHTLPFYAFQSKRVILAPRRQSSSLNRIPNDEALTSGSWGGRFHHLSLRRSIIYCYLSTAYRQLAFAVEGQHISRMPSIVGSLDRDVIDIARKPCTSLASSSMPFKLLSGRFTRLPFQSIIPST